MIELLVGSAVGAVALYRGVRYVRGMRAYWRTYQRSAQFERAVRDAREGLVTTSYRVAVDADRALIAILDGTAPLELRALAACGFTLLGDIVVENTRRGPTVAIRVLVDAARTTCASIVVVRKYPSTVRLALTSYAEHDLFTTRRGPWPSLAEPPLAHRRELAADTPQAVIVASHRLLATGGPLFRIATVDDMVAQLSSFHARMVAWRDAQPPDDLLDADLHSLFGDRDPHARQLWARRLRTRPPEAIARRAPKS